MTNSLYEHLFPLTTVMKQRVLDNFDGDTLNERWNKRDISGTGTFAMVDAVDEGFSITTGSSINNASLIDFNQIRQYSETASILLMVFRRVASSAGRIEGGFKNLTDISTDFVAVRDLVQDTFKRFITADATTAKTTNTSVSVNTLFTSYKIEMKSASAECSIADILEVTHTTELPTAKLEPYFRVRTQTSSVREGRIRYLEAYNT